MPVAEAGEVERSSYELAFHVLPTVAEGEVAGVVEKIKTHITNAGGSLGIEEAPERIDLAYEIVKHLEGKNRRFTSAYFGWVRFTAEPGVIADMIEEIEAETNVLRHLLIKLTKVEEAHPFYYHEALASQKQVTDVEESAVVAEAPKTEAAPAEEAAETDAEASTEEAAEETETAAEDTEAKDEA